MIFSPAHKTLAPKERAPHGGAHRPRARAAAQLAAAVVLALSLAPAAALAGNGHGKGHGHGDDRGAWDCPPGLAKKHNGCRPPGQAKGDVAYYREAPYRVGDRIVTRYVVIEEPRRYGLDPRYTYYQSDDYVFRVDRDTGKVLSLIGAVSALLN